MDDFITGNEFASAACSVIGLDVQRVTKAELLTEGVERFALRFTLDVSAHTLELIAKKMKENKVQGL